jgi:hypothetical protein
MQGPEFKASNKKEKRSQHKFCGWFLLWTIPTLCSSSCHPSREYSMFLANLAAKFNQARRKQNVSLGGENLTCAWKIFL